VEGVGNAGGVSNSHFEIMVGLPGWKSPRSDRLVQKIDLFWLVCGNQLTPSGQNENCGSGVGRFAQTQHSRYNGENNQTSVPGNRPRPD
jgi:hypothetical protein